MSRLQLLLCLHYIFTHPSLSPSYLLSLSQVELVLTVEEQLPKRLRRYFIVGSREILPNRSLTLWEMVRNRIWGRKRFKISEKISNALNPPQVSRAPEKFGRYPLHYVPHQTPWHFELLISSF